MPFRSAYNENAELDSAGVEPGAGGFGFYRGHFYIPIGIFDRPYLENSVLEMSETSFSCCSCPNTPWISGITTNSAMWP